MTQIEAIALDFNGVLADSTEAHTIARRTAMQKYGQVNNLPALAAIPEELHHEAYLHGTSSKGIISWLLSEAGIALEPSDIAAINDIKKDEFQQLSEQGLPAIPGAADYVQWASSMVTPARLGIASNSVNIEPFLARLELTEAVGFIVDATQRPRQLRKPHPYVYSRLAELIGVDPKNMMSVDDSPEGLVSAVSAGTLAVGLETTHPRDQLSAAHIIVSNMAELKFLTQNLLA